MHLFLTIPSLSKQGGGPANVVQNLSEHLIASGVSVTLVTCEADSGQSEALPREPRVRVVRVPVNGRAGWWSAFGEHLKTAIRQSPVTKNSTVVHDFGIWLPSNHAIASVCSRLGVPRVCSTCGMLATWALRHKVLKKRLAWWLYQRRDLSRATLLVSTSEQEVQDTRRLVAGKHIALVPNGVEMPGTSGQWSAVSGQRKEGNGLRTAVFLGRIHPVKGLKNLVEAWHRVQPAGWRCILAGPDEAGHRTELETLLRQRNLATVFRFPGMMEDERKWALLRDADLFVLPSFTENFGVAAAEALSSGVPVIATKGTPWEQLRTHQCGWWIDIGVESLAAALREAISLSDQERCEMGRRGRRLVEENYGWPKIGRDMKAVYGWVLGKEPRPECVVV